jgi:hypothetical protein
MKRLISLFLPLILIFSMKVSAQTDTSATNPYADSLASEIIPYDENPEINNTPIEQPRLEWGGYVMTDDRMRIDGYKLNWQEYRLDFNAQYHFGERARFYGDIWIRGIKFPDIEGSSDLSFTNKVIPIDIDIREAYFDIYGLFTKNLDVRIGRQRIAWGTGDRLNPTDNLNSYDLEDIWDFGRHTASNAIQLNYYAGNWTFTGVGILQFTPSILPNSDWTPAFMPDFTVPEVIYDSTSAPGLTIPVFLQTGIISDSISLPQRDFKHSPSFGFKVKRSIGAWDLSLSYVYTHDALPLIEHIHTNLTVDTLIIDFPTTIYANATMDVKAYLKYPVQKIIGFDFAGSLWGIGLRGEAACFIPEKVHLLQTMHYEAPMMSLVRDSILPDSVILDGKPYVKYLIGIDYTFKHNVYLNFQYLHGFLHERGNSELNDYFMLAVEYTLCNNKLKLSLLNSALQVGDWKNFGENYAVMYMPELSYRPVDNAEITLGAHIIDGSGSYGFGKVNKNDDVFVRFKYSF